MLVHVVDAATENPVKDYMTVKEVKYVYSYTFAFIHLNNCLRFLLQLD